MFDNKMIVEDSLKATDTGFSIEARLPYYRGLGLSMIENVAISINGEAVPREDITLSLRGRTWTLDEMESEYGDRWNFGEKALVGVKRASGQGADAALIGILGQGMGRFPNGKPPLFMGRQYQADSSAKLPLHHPGESRGPLRDNCKLLQLLSNWNPASAGVAHVLRRRADFRRAIQEEGDSPCSRGCSLRLHGKGIAVISRLPSASIRHWHRPAPSAPYRSARDSGRPRTTFARRR